MTIWHSRFFIFYSKEIFLFLIRNKITIFAKSFTYK